MWEAWRGGEKSMRRKASLRLVPVLLSFACLFGCGSGDPERNMETARETESRQTQTDTEKQTGEGTAAQVQSSGSAQKVTGSREPGEDFEPYQAPEFADSVFHADLAEGGAMSCWICPMPVWDMELSRRKRIPESSCRSRQKEPMIPNIHTMFPRTARRLFFRLQAGTGSIPFLWG